MFVMGNERAKLAVLVVVVVGVVIVVVVEYLYGAIKTEVTIRDVREQNFRTKSLPFQ